MTRSDATWTIGSRTFAYLHDFNWNDYNWTKPIPEVADLEDLEDMVNVEHPELLKPGIGNVEGRE